MNCQQASELLSAYIEGEVTGRASEALEAHLGHCAGCCEELETLHTAIALLEAPKSLVRPEGLLEEFKAKYLPEAEAAAAPRWGIRLPAMPRFEWPSLGQILLPVGGLAAGAAAALLIGLHALPLAGGIAPAGPAPRPSQVAVLPVQTVAPTSEAGQPTALRFREVASPEHVASVAQPEAPVAIRSEFRPRRHHRHLMTAWAVRPHWRGRRASGELAGSRPAHHRTARPHGYTLANRPTPVPPVSDAALTRAVERHQQAVAPPDAQWQDQVVMIRRQAAAVPTADGYVEATYKDLATGQVTRSAGDGSSVAAPVPTGNGSAGGGQ